MNGAGGAGDSCPSPAPAGPSILWCSSPTDIWATDVPSQGWACSPSTKVLHWDGAGWTTMTQHDQYYFESAWARSAGDVWIVGHAGSVSWFHELVVLHWNGARLQQLMIADPAAMPAAPGLMAWQETVFGTADGGIWIRGDRDDSWRITTPVAASCLVDSVL